MKYYYRETTGISATGWSLLPNVSTVAGAKSAATRAQVFQGTTLHIGTLTAVREAEDANPTVIYVKQADALDMAKPGRWRQVMVDLRTGTRSLRG